MFKSISHFWQKRRERFYLKNRWHLILDYSLGIIILLLLAILASLFFYQPKINSLFSKVPVEKHELDLNNPPLSFSFEEKNPALKLSDGLELKLSLKNSSQFLIQNIKTNFLVVDKNFVIEKIENNKNINDLTINNNQISISSLNPNENREVNVLIRFKAKTDTERTIKWQAQSEYTVSDQVIKESTSLPDINLAAELDASARAYYNSPQGDQLGSGPIPPLVSLPTNYWIFFDVKSAGDFKNLVFSAKLPSGVELTDRRSLLAGDFKYNPASRQVIWTVPELKNQSDSYRVGFEVQFIPSDKQLDKTPAILTDIKYYAHDILVNNENSGDLDNITTNLDFDRINKGQGKVSLP